jgi:hypothetical protein
MTATSTRATTQAASPSDGWRLVACADDWFWTFRSGCDSL